MMANVKTEHPAFPQPRSSENNTFSWSVAISATVPLFYALLYRRFDLQQLLAIEAQAAWVQTIIWLGKYWVILLALPLFFTVAEVYRNEAKVSGRLVILATAVAICCNAALFSVVVMLGNHS